MKNYLKRFISISIIIGTILFSPYTFQLNAENIEISFSDVKKDDWFYNDIVKLNSLGVIHGYSNGTFMPNDSISYAEFTKLLISSLGVTPNVEEDYVNTGSWANDFISTALYNNIITLEDLDTIFKPDESISRNFMTKMIILALNIDIANIDSPFSDTSNTYANTAYNEYLIKGYKTSDNVCEFRGEENSSRAESVALVIRALEYKMNPFEYKKNAILDNARDNVLNTESELLDLFYIQNSELVEEFTFNTTIPLDEWMEIYKHANIMHPDVFVSSGFDCSYFDNTNVYTIKLEYYTDIEEVKRSKKEATEKANTIASTILKDDMTQYDKLKAIHDYLILNCKYDYTNYLSDTIPADSFKAYGALVKGVAVCQGYSAAFNMLCELAEIKTVTIAGSTKDGGIDDHTWNMVLVDNNIVFVDVTFDDPVPDKIGKISYTYFSISEHELELLGHTWDKNTTNIKYFY